MKVLHLEDDPQDAEIIQQCLREAWPDCEVRTVADEAGFEAGLAGRPDVVLSDFTMPAFSGVDALARLQVVAPEIPFIFVSGTIGEERAVEALQAGAWDYVIKDRMKRLVFAVGRAVVEAKRRRDQAVEEERRQRGQRLEHIGMLAAGIAHDFNNILTPMVMGLSILRHRHKDPADERIFATMESSVRRGTGLVEQIMGFAKGMTGTLTAVEVAPLVREVVAQVEAGLENSVRIEVQIAGDVGAVRANPTQLYQVLLNLCINARDAMPGGGVLSVTARRERVEAGEGTVIATGDYVRFAVRDTGSGMVPEVVARIWEPFFSTKQAGRGTGLGLSTVRGIVQNHRGVVTVESEPGKGTVFQVWWPAARSEGST
ncbi:MAG: response regulator [Verrucomicrobia bacterium]|nr:response regulator [Verrucomicrobiota bacterium]